MNSFMRVNVQVVNLGKRELERVRQQVVQLAQAQAMAQRQAAGFGGSINRGLNNLERYGKNLQWTGRQIEYNFTLPIALAGAAATKFALDNEKAATRLEKVYGDMNASMQATYSREIPALRNAFEQLSNVFGVHQSEVLDIAADWAAAGSSGIALARQTRATLEAMIIGDMNAADATKALIAVQAQYNLSSAELRDTLAMLNMVENQTATSMQDLITAFTRAAGSARTAGVSTRELAGFVAALVPAAGSAERAGNALRTMISRVMSPTGDAAEVMGLMGINVREAGWQSLTASQRLMRMAQASEELTQGQKAVVSATVASRWNITAFDVLMRELVSNMGYYNTALESTASRTDNLRQYQKELGVYLSSSPQAFKILTVQIQNMMARAIVPLLPAMLRLASYITRLVTGFTNLSPGVQHMVMLSLALLAAVGPLTRITGASILLFERLARVVTFAAGSFGRFGGVFVRVGSNLADLIRLPFSKAADGISWIVANFSRLGAPEVLRAVSAPARLFVTSLTNAMFTMAGGIAQGLANLGKLMLANSGSISQMFTAVWGAATAKLTILWSQFTSFYRLTSWALVGWWGSITKQLGVIWGAFTTLAGTLWGALVTVLRTQWAVFTGWLSATWGAPPP